MMQKGYKREAKGLAVLHCFFGLFIVIVVVLAVSVVLNMDYSDRIDPTTSVRPYVETTVEASFEPEETQAVVADLTVTATPEVTQAPTPTPTPTPIPTPTPTPTPEPTAFPANCAAQYFTQNFVETPTTDKAVYALTYCYRSAADDNRLVHLQGYGYINEADWDAANSIVFLTLRRDSNKQRVIAPCAMQAGVTGIEHAAALCAHPESADFDVVLDVHSLSDDIYTVGMVLATSNLSRLEYVEFDSSVSFTVLGGQILGDIAVTE